MIGQKFNKLTVKEDTGKRINRGIVWLCECECGNLVEVRANNLRKGHTKSCGCMKRKSDSMGPEIFPRGKLSIESQSMESQEENIKDFKEVRIKTGDEIEKPKFIKLSTIIEFEGKRETVYKCALRIGRNPDELASIWTQGNKTKRML